MNNRDNVHKLPSGTPQGKYGNGGGGDSTVKRLARLEERVNHLATSSQLQETITIVEKLRGEVGILRGEVGILRGEVGILNWIGGIIAIGVISAVVKLYG